MANSHVSERVGSRLFEVGLGVIGGIVSGIFGGTAAGFVGGGSIMLLGFALSRSKMARRLAAATEEPGVEITLVVDAPSIEDGFSYGTSIKPGSSEHEFRLGLRSNSPDSSPLTKVVIEAASAMWAGIVLERPLRLLHHTGPAAAIPHGTGPTVFAVLATQPGEFNPAYFTYYDGNEKTNPDDKKEDRQAVLTLRATGDSGRAAYMRVRLTRVLGLRWKVDDGIPAHPVSLDELVGDGEASRMRAEQYVKDFEERKKT